MINGLKRGDRLGSLPRMVGGVEIAVKPGEVAAAYFQADAVPFFEHVTGGHQVYGVLLNGSGGYWARLVRALPVPRSYNAVHQAPRRAAGFHVDQLGGEICVLRRGGSVQRNCQGTSHIHVGFQRGCAVAEHVVPGLN